MPVCTAPSFSTQVIKNIKFNRISYFDGKFTRLHYISQSKILAFENQNILLFNTNDCHHYQQFSVIYSNLPFVFSSKNGVEQLNDVSAF